MSRAIKNCVAALLLSVVAAYFGHLLAKGLDGVQPRPPEQAAFVLGASAGSDMDAGEHGHRHDHGMSCDKWLCSGFSGVILGTVAIVPLCIETEKNHFIGTLPDMFSDRTIEPRPNPPRPS